MLSIYTITFIVENNGGNILFWGALVIICIISIKKLFYQFKNFNYMINAKSLEAIKITFGLLLLIFPVIGGIILYLDSFGIQLYNGVHYDSISEVLFSNQASLFLGLCGVAGAILINSLKTKD